VKARIAALVVALACAGIASLARVALVAQTPVVQNDQRLRSSVEVTVVTATVRDADGKLAVDLPREAFEMFEDGKPVAITQFTNERVPLGLGLLLDISESMFGRKIKDAGNAVERFLLELLAPTDAFFVMAFNHQPRLLFGWKTDPTGVHESLAKLYPTGSTAIYDAISASIPYLDHRPRERAALVLITDGEDRASDITLHDLRPALVRTDAFVYAIAIDMPSPNAAISQQVNVATLNEITNQSGGRTEVVRDSADLQTATANIADELNHQYVLGYSSPTPGDGKYHTIRVRVNRDGYKVRARAGYVAIRRSGSR
jgi:Ca-activated chloride channel family protein